MKAPVSKKAVPSRSIRGNPLRPALLTGKTIPFANFPEPILRMDPIGFRPIATDEVPIGLDAKPLRGMGRSSPRPRRSAVWK